MSLIGFVKPKVESDFQIPFALCFFFFGSIQNMNADYCGDLDYPSFYLDSSITVCVDKDSAFQ